MLYQSPIDYFDGKNVWDMFAFIHNIRAINYKMNYEMLKTFHDFSLYKCSLL